MSGTRLAPPLSDCVTLTAKNTEVGSYLLIVMPRQGPVDLHYWSVLWYCWAGVRFGLSCSCSVVSFFSP